MGRLNGRVEGRSVKEISKWKPRDRKKKSRPKLVRMNWIQRMIIQKRLKEETEKTGIVDD